ncbi:MAG: SPOR domain-containing protein [Gemmatimonadales bacterium]
MRFIPSIIFVFCIFSVFSTAPAQAQTDPRLVDVIRDAQEGQGDSARIKIKQLLASTSPSDTLYPQILYTQAMVSNNAADMRRQLQRVAVEHPSSSWADDALLRLVQLDYASGNLPGAARNLERIRSDYPGTTLLPQASYWAARTYFDQKNPSMACRWLADGLAASRGNVELQNQLGYLNQRCAQVAIDSAPRTPADSPVAVASAAPDTAARLPRADSVPPVTSAPAPSPSIKPTPKPAPPETTSRTPAPRPAPTPPAGRFRVQITAVRTAATADAMAKKLKARGLAAVIVQEGGLYKVRVGSYSNKAEAVAAVPAIKAKLGGSPFVVAEP